MTTVDPEVYLRKFLSTSLFSYMPVDQTGFNTYSENASIKDYTSYEEDDSPSLNGWTCRVSGFGFQPSLDGGFLMWSNGNQVDINTNWGIHVIRCMQKRHVCDVWKIKIANYGPLSGKNKEKIMSTIREFAKGRAVSLENKAFLDLYKLLNIKDGNRRRLHPVLLLTTIAAPLQAAIASIALGLGLIAADSVSKEENKPDSKQKEIIVIENVLNQFDILLYLEIQNFFKNFVASKDLIDEQQKNKKFFDEYNPFRKKYLWKSIGEIKNESTNIVAYPIITNIEKEQDKTNKKAEKIVEEEEKKANSEIIAEEEVKSQLPNFTLQRLIVAGANPNTHVLERLRINLLNTTRFRRLNINVNTIRATLRMNLVANVNEQEIFLRLQEDLQILQDVGNQNVDLHPVFDDTAKIIDLIMAIATEVHREDPSRFEGLNIDAFLNNLQIFNYLPNSTRQEISTHVILLSNLMLNVMNFVRHDAPIRNGGETIRNILLLFGYLLHNNFSETDLQRASIFVNLHYTNVVTPTREIMFIQNIIKRAKYILNIQSRDSDPSAQVRLNGENLMQILRGIIKNQEKDPDLSDVLDDLQISPEEIDRNDVIMRESFWGVFNAPLAYFGFGSGSSQAESEAFMRAILLQLKPPSNASNFVNGSEIIDAISNSRIFSAFRQRFMNLLPERNLMNPNELEDLGNSIAQVVNLLPEQANTLPRLSTSRARNFLESFQRLGSNNEGIITRLISIQHNSMDLMSGWVNRFAEHMENNSPNLVAAFSLFRRGIAVINQLRNNSEFRTIIWETFKKILIGLGFLVVGNVALNLLNKGGEKIEKSLQNIIEDIKKKDPEANVEIIKKSESEKIEKIEVLQGFEYIDDILLNNN